MDGRLEVEKSLLRLDVLAALPLPLRLSAQESEVLAEAGKAVELADDGRDRILGSGIAGIGKRG